MVGVWQQSTRQRAAAPSCAGSGWPAGANWWSGICVDEEQFGPVVAVVRVEGEAEALELANRDELGLDASVFTADHDRAMTLAERIDAGAVRINGAPSHGIGNVPFGGTGASGIGRQGIDYTIEAFVERKSIVH